MKPTQFNRLYLENWRNFNIVDAELQRRVFLVGPNASGKSNLLDALRFLHDVVTVGGGLQAATRKRGGVSKLRSLSARRYSHIAILADLGNSEGHSIWRYELRFSQDSQQRPIIEEETVFQGQKRVLGRPDKADRSDPERLTQTHLEQVNVNKPFREVVSFFDSIRYLHIVPQLIREPDRSVGRHNDPYGGDFLEQIARTPRRTQDARLKRISGTLRVAVPQLTELKLYRDERGLPHVRGRYEHWRSKGAWQTEEQFSDGTLRLLGLLWVILDGSGPLLLEEPELSLHPEVVRYLPQLFARIQRKTARQILTSTHSTDLLRDRDIGRDEVLLLEPSPEGTQVRRASSIGQIVDLLKGGLSMADAVMPRTRPRSAQQIALFGG
jgi:predicted ATPase